MLTAKEARKMADNYNGNRIYRIKESLQKTIENHAAAGYYWYSWDYDYDEITSKERNQIVQSLQNAGYDVKDIVFLKQVTIRW